MFRGVKQRELFYFFQDPLKEPPVFPPFREKDVWENIVKENSKQLKLYLDNILMSQDRQRMTKKRRLDDIDILDNVSFLKFESEKMLKSQLQIINTKTGWSYWDSPEAFYLFSPKNNERVTTCLTRRIEILQLATVDDDTLISLLEDDINFVDVLTHQKQHLRYQCIYLRKCYEISLQYMNEKTWTECIKMALVELSDQAILYIMNDKTIREWNISFRQK